METHQAVWRMVASLALVARGVVASGFSYGYNRAERLEHYGTGRELVTTLVDHVELPELPEALLGQPAWVLKLVR
jgi:hypothetical protein